MDSDFISRHLILITERKIVEYTMPRRERQIPDNVNVRSALYMQRLFERFTTEWRHLIGLSSRALGASPHLD